MDVNWYAIETIAHQRLAELRVSVARCRLARTDGAARRRGTALAPALVRVGHRLLAGLGAVWSSMSRPADRLTDETSELGLGRKEE